MIKRAVVSIRVVNVDCPHCDAPMHEGATVHEHIPWGEVIECWQCRKSVKLPANPFTLVKH